MTPAIRRAQALLFGHSIPTVRDVLSAALDVEEIALALNEHNAERMECMNHDGYCCPAGDAHDFSDPYAHQAAALRAMISGPA